MSNRHKGRSGLTRIFHAIGYSLDGLRTAYLGESAFRQEFWLAAVMLPAAFWLGRSWVEVALLAAIDRVSFELHDLSKRAKDLASAAVFLSLLLCGSIWAGAILQRIGT